MNKKLYKLMNWADIEEIIYSECDHPQDLLGPHTISSGTLVQAYFPGAKEVSIKWLSADPLIGDTITQMELADEDGYFAVILPEKNVISYTYAVTYVTSNGKKTLKKNTIQFGDPYRHERIISKSSIDEYSNGLMKDAYKTFGAKSMNHCGENGVLFSVYAPNALRVSVVGEFNNWDGRIHQMKRIDNSFFELFIPGELNGNKYQYELKLKGDKILKRNDPFATSFSDGISVVNNAENFNWSDSDYIKSLKKKPEKLLIYELSSKHVFDNPKKFKKDCEKLVKHIKMQGYKYVQLNPQSYEDSIINNFYVINKNLLDDTCLKEFVDICHNNGIGVIFDWDASGFGRISNCLENFDGTALYEHMNPLQGLSSDGKKMLFQYGKPEVISFLMSNAFYWINEFHADGICINSVAQMMYLDYGKIDGSWIPNVYGGNENIEAVSFIKSLINEINNTKCVFVIAEDSSTHAGMTTLQKDGGLGFDFKWNEGFTSDYFEYMSYDPIIRSSLHTKLVDEFVYSYAERFVLPLSDELSSTGILFTDRFPGDEDMKRAALRLSVAYQYVHPGQKLVAESVDTSETKLCAALNKLFEHETSLGKVNDEPTSFEWLSNMKADGCYVSFVRKTDDPEEMIVAVVNFAGIPQTITTGVPYEGKYEEVLNTDNLIFGGSGMVNESIMRADAMPADGRPQSITVKLAAQSMTIMRFIPYTEEELALVIEERIRNFTPVKRTKKNGK